MYNWLLVITFADDAARTTVATEFEDALQALPKARSSLAARSPNHPFKLNGGDLVCRIVFQDRADYDNALKSPSGRQAMSLLNDTSTVAAVDEVAYQGDLSGGTASQPTIYRVALFCANIDPTPDRLAQFRSETSLMPCYIKTIQRWQLSTADAARGRRPWTHVWEQEYADLTGLTGTYLMHPDHWAHVDRWFDPEYPEFLVDPVLVNTFCPIATSVIVS